MGNKAGAARAPCRSLAGPTPERPSPLPSCRLFQIVSGDQCWQVLRVFSGDDLAMSSSEALMAAAVHTALEGLADLERMQATLGEHWAPSFQGHIDGTDFDLAALRQHCAALQVGRGGAPEPGGVERPGHCPRHKPHAGASCGQTITGVHLPCRHAWLGWRWMSKR